jgi:hypothetical protein
LEIKRACDGRPGWNRGMQCPSGNCVRATGRTLRPFKLAVAGAIATGRPRAAPDDDDPAQPEQPPSESSISSPQGSERPRRRRRRALLLTRPRGGVSWRVAAPSRVACADRCHSAMPRRPSVHARAAAFDGASSHGNDRTRGENEETVSSFRNE